MITWINAILLCWILMENINFSLCFLNDIQQRQRWRGLKSTPLHRLDLWHLSIPVFVIPVFCMFVQYMGAVWPDIGYVSCISVVFVLSKYNTVWYGSHKYDGIITWWHFPHICPFVMGIHWPTVNFPHKWSVMLWWFVDCWVRCWTNSRVALHFLRHTALMTWKQQWNITYATSVAS